MSRSPARQTLRKPPTLQTLSGVGGWGQRHVKLDAQGNVRFDWMTLCFVWLRGD